MLPVKRSASRYPPSPQPAAAMAAVGTTSTSQDLSRLRAIATRPRIALRLVAVFLRESSRRPVRLRRVAAAGAVERSDVLERHENVPVELDVGDVVDVAVRGEDAVLILAAEERDLDLLALVLVRVVLHERCSTYPMPPRSSRRRIGGHELLVAEPELVDAAVLERVNRLADAVTPKRAERPSVRDDEDAAAAMAACYAFDGVEDAREMVLPRLAVVVLCAGEPLLDLRARESGPGSDVDLAQRGIDDDGDIVRRCHDHGGRVGAAKVACVHGVQPGPAQAFGENPGLRPSCVVERRVGPALEAALPVPIRLAVACQEDRRHEG